MKTRIRSTWMIIAISLLFPTIQAIPTERSFPAATPESQGLDPSAVIKLAEIVQGFFHEGQIAGAELLVVKNRKAVLHEAIGWKDAKDRTPMTRDTIFNIRSMSKPITGTLAQMLIDDGKLSLEDPVSKHLPFFSKHKAAEILVEHLITHRSGLPLTCINKSLADYGDLEALAREAAEAGPEFAPGTAFQYSDAGSDSLGAVLEKAGGAPLHELQQGRIFDPVGMKDTFSKMRPEDPRIARMSSNHAGMKAFWNRYWKPGDEPFYPFAMGSQSVHTTPMDFARFLALWLDHGLAGEKRLLSKAAVARGLEPVSAMSYPTGLQGLEVHYGRMWMLWVDEKAEGKPRVVAFGHGGSDGTYAIAFPDHDLMVLYFTQSRGQQTLPTFERALDALILNPDPKRAAALTVKIPPELLRPYLGIYRTEGQDLYRAVLIQDGKLSVEIPGNQVLTLEQEDDKDHWHLEALPAQKVVFERSNTGEIVAFRSMGPVATEYSPRLKPAADLPSVENLMDRYLAAHGADKLEALGAFRLTGSVMIEKRNLKGTVVDLYEGRRRRKMETNFEGSGDQVIAFDGEQMWSKSQIQKEPAELAGVQAEQIRHGSFGSLLGDWRRDYREVQVLYRLKAFEEETFVVRTVPYLGPASTKYVGVKSSLLIAEDRITELPGMGPLGSLVIFEDYRDVKGVKIPFRIRAKSAHPLIGTIVTQYEKVETHLDLPARAFELDGAERTF